MGERKEIWGLVRRDGFCGEVGVGVRKRERDWRVY